MKLWSKGRPLKEEFILMKEKLENLSNSTFRKRRWRKEREESRRKNQKRPTWLLLNTLNIINQLILPPFEYIGHNIYKRLLLVLASSNRIPTSTRTPSLTSKPNLINI